MQWTTRRGNVYKDTRITLDKWRQVVMITSVIRTFTIDASYTHRGKIVREASLIVWTSYWRELTCLVSVSIQVNGKWQKDRLKLYSDQPYDQEKYHIRSKRVDCATDWGDWGGMRRYEAHTFPKSKNCCAKKATENGTRETHSHGGNLTGSRRVYIIPRC